MSASEMTRKTRHCEWCGFLYGHSRNCPKKHVARVIDPLEQQQREQAVLQEMRRGMRKEGEHNG